MRVSITFGLLISAVLMSSAAALADLPPLPPLPPGGPMGVKMIDPIGEQLFPPDLVLENSQAIGLTDAQKASVQSAVLNAQSQFTRLQWRIQDEMQSLARLLKPAKVDSAAVMAQLNKELDVERQMKQTQLGLMIRIKNLLTSDQQAKLRQLMPKMRVFKDEQYIIRGAPGPQ